MKPRKKRVAKENVDDVIELAARDDDALTLDEERAYEAACAELKAHSRKKLLSKVGSVLLATFLIAVFLGLTGRSEPSELNDGDQAVQGATAEFSSMTAD